MTRIFVEAKLSVPGYHCWPDAPECVRFLQHPHRHMFVIRVVVPVTHTERDVEIIMLRQRIHRELAREYGEVSAWLGGFDFGCDSCESIASYLLRVLEASRVSVHEDDENGAIVEVTK
jgi:hypothetical protein